MVHISSEIQNSALILTVGKFSIQMRLKHGQIDYIADKFENFVSNLEIRIENEFISEESLDFELMEEFHDLFMIRSSIIYNDTNSENPQKIGTLTFENTFIANEFESTEISTCFSYSITFDNKEQTFFALREAVEKLRSIENIFIDHIVHDPLIFPDNSIHSKDDNSLNYRVSESDVFSVNENSREYLDYRKPEGELFPSAESYKNNEYSVNPSKHVSFSETKHNNSPIDMSLTSNLSRSLAKGSKSNKYSNYNPYQPTETVDVHGLKAKFPSHDISRVRNISPSNVYDDL
jgi:hypothetical protein